MTIKIKLGIFNVAVFIVVVAATAVVAIVVVVSTLDDGILKIKRFSKFIFSYRVFHRFRQAKFDNGNSIFATVLAASKNEADF